MYVPRELEEVPPCLGGLSEEAGQGVAALERVAAPTGGHYVAVGPVSAAHPRLDVIHAESLRFLYEPAIDTAVLVSRKKLEAVHPVLPVITTPVNLPDRGRRMIFDQLTRFLDTEEATATPDDVPPRLTHKALEGLRMSRSRERILNNLDEMYREAFERAKETADPAAMASLDFAYRREQLYFEILLDVRDAIEKK